MIRNLLKQAIKSRNEIQKNSLRSVLAAVERRNIAKPNSVSTDEDLMKVVKSLHNKRLKTMKELEKRPDLQEIEKNEADFLTKLHAELEK